MQIAYLASSCIPSRTANSIHVMKMSQALGRAGHEVTLFVPEKGKAISDDKELFEYYGVDKCFNIYYGPWIKFKGRRYWYAWHVSRAAKQSGAELVYGRNLAACSMACALGMHVAFEAHSPIEQEGRVIQALFSWMIDRESFQYLVVITYALKLYFEQRWPQLRGRVLVAPDGADPLKPDLSPAILEKREGRLQVGYTGHLYKGKGAELVLEIARTCPEFDFHLVGGTDSDVKRWKSRSDIPKNLHLHGYHPPSEIPRYLLAFDVALLPNQPSVLAHGGADDIGRWTSPLKLFEYMAAGCAIVCSDVPVLQEVAQHDKNMLVCRHDSVHDWAQALRRLAGEPNFRRSLGEEASDQLKKKYSWDARAINLLSHYYANNCID